MDRMQGLQTVRTPSRRLLLTLVVVAALAFIAGTYVDSFRSMLAADAVDQPAPAGIIPWPGMWNGSGYDGSAPSATSPDLTRYWGGPYVVERVQGHEKQAERVPFWPSMSDQAQTR